METIEPTNLVGRNPYNISCAKRKQGCESEYAVSIGYEPLHTVRRMQPKQLLGQRLLFPHLLVRLPPAGGSGCSGTRKATERVEAEIVYHPADDKEGERDSQQHGEYHGVVSESTVFQTMSISYHRLCRAGHACSLITAPSLAVACTDSLPASAAYIGNKSQIDTVYFTLDPLHSLVHGEVGQIQPCTPALASWCGLSEAPCISWNLLPNRLHNCILSV